MAQYLSRIAFVCFIVVLIGCSGAASRTLAPWPTSLEGHSPALGNPQARVTITEFVDFQCGHCRENYYRMKQLLTQYPDEVRIVFKHFPLRNHPQAIPAAEAAIAAAEQGKFWSMHDQIFEHQSALALETYLSLAADLKLDAARFRLDMLDPRAHEILRRDRALASSLGVTSVPALFVDREPVRDLGSIEELSAIVERHLTAQVP